MSTSGQSESRSQERTLGGNAPVVCLFTMPNCQQCIATKRRLDRNGTVYTLVDITEDPGAYDYVVGLGHKQAPIVVTDTGAHWSGYRMDLIDALKETA